MNRNKYPKKYCRPPSTDILMASTSNLFELEQIDVENTSIDDTLIFEEIHKEIGDYLAGQGNDADSAEGVFDFLENLNNRLQEDFDKLIGEDTDKKRFVKALMRIFMLLLNTSRHGRQNQKNTQNRRRNYTENMARTKVTPHRGESPLPSWLLCQNRRHQRTKRTYPCKIKLTLLEQKTVDITKDGNIIKTIGVRRKSTYFSDRNTRVF